MILCPVPNMLAASALHWIRPIPVDNFLGHDHNTPRSEYEGMSASRTGYFSLLVFSYIGGDLRSPFVSDLNLSTGVHKYGNVFSPLGDSRAGSPCHINRQSWHGLPARETAKPAPFCPCGRIRDRIYETLYLAGRYSRSSISYCPGFLPIPRNPFSPATASLTLPTVTRLVPVTNPALGFLVFRSAIDLASCSLR